MRTSLKQLLDSTELYEIAGFAANSDALRILLGRTAEVQAMSEALRSGELTEGDIREFVRQVLDGFKLGESLFGDIALAAIAVALEPIHMSPDSFAEEYIRDLSRIDLAEMSRSSRVAKACLKARTSLTMNHSRTRTPSLHMAFSSEAWSFSTVDQAHIANHTRTISNSLVRHDAAA